MTMARDFYAKPMKALKAIRKKTTGASNNDERTVLLRKALDEWDSEKLGDWKDAVAVAARRKGIPSPKLYLSLAAVAGGIPRTAAGYTDDKGYLKRASEIGSVLEKLMEHEPEAAAKLIKRGGGVKKLAGRGVSLPTKKSRKTSKRKS